VALVYPDWLQPSGDDLRLEVLVVPRASRNRIMGVHDGRLKIQLTAPPVEGRANQALVRFVAEIVGIARVQVEVIGGATNKRKSLRLRGVEPQLAVLKLMPPGPAN